MVNIKRNSSSKQFYLTIKLTSEASILPLKQLNHGHKSDSNTNNSNHFNYNKCEANRQLYIHTYIYITVRRTT